MDGQDDEAELMVLLDVFSWPIPHVHSDVGYLASKLVAGRLNIKARQARTPQ